MSSLTIQPHKIGDVDSTFARTFRIVHISDTHLNHDKYLSECLIPDGDVLVHSGDFSKVSISKCLGRDHRDEIRLINQFFARLPHRYKIFVAGNHESSFVDELNSCQERISGLLTECIYLQARFVLCYAVYFIHNSIFIYSISFWSDLAQIVIRAHSSINAALYKSV